MTALITGASSGFGADIAKIFAHNGHRVIILARREERLIALKNELGALCEMIVADVRDTQFIESALKALPEAFQNIDMLVNNAGLALGLTSADKADMADWQQMVEVNVLALIKLTHLLLPQMVAQGYGHIINIGSIAGTYPYPGGNVYGATKAFVKQFSLNLRADLYDKNIRVTDIEPGLCDGSEFSQVRFKGDVQKAKSVYADTTPLMSADIAQCVFWVASLPHHVNINRLEIMPTTQAPAALNVYKNHKQ
ncbi:SDR family NAD(P)-dependent oxidoreductase [Helicobacter jaachi]|uniref:SDR family NAD(P)-dependent oxidoreductase n=1 Tax=Helicobacter jaachi TaxID=1677920 RepID=A0A4U8TC45_9HELI|nr:SDR family NAD(P)-dependent oxidoreductase [Helicobacter jaachi]TLD97495.1 SDR family NAD(P)-dependent oxidoreductase [Helicobacter jaachi]